MNFCVINASGLVINIVVGAVPGLDCVPWDGVAKIGWTWNGTSFVAPPAASTAPTVSQRSAAVTDSYNASLQRRANALQAKGNYAAAAALYLKAAGVPT